MSSRILYLLKTERRILEATYIDRHVSFTCCHYTVYLTLGYE